MYGTAHVYDAQIYDAHFAFACDFVYGFDLDVFPLCVCRCLLQSVMCISFQHWHGPSLIGLRGAWRAGCACHVLHIVSPLCVASGRIVSVRASIDAACHMENTGWSRCAHLYHLSALCQHLLRTPASSHGAAQPVSVQPFACTQGVMADVRRGESGLCFDARLGVYLQRKLRENLGGCTDVEPLLEKTKMIQDETCSS